MKKGVLLNSQLSYVISDLGHTESLTIGDAGLPVPENVEKIDLAVRKGIPDFLSVLSAVLSELRVEKVIMAEEIKSASSELHQKIVERINEMEEKESIRVEIEYVSHQTFKSRTQESRAVVRTGEFTPYANVILVSGVVF